MAHRKLKADSEAFQTRLSDRPKREQFFAWLEREGYDKNEITWQMLDEFDELQMKESRETRAELSTREIDEIDPSRMEEGEWNAGLDEWEREGHNIDTIPVERPKWEALLARRAARLKKEEAQRTEAKRRHYLINSLKPPKPGDIVLNGKSILDAQSAYREGREKLSEAWTQRYEELPGDVAEAWDLYHLTEGDPAMCLRARKPTVDEFPADLERIKDALDDPEYQEFQTYSAAVLQQLEQLEASIEHALNPPAGSRLPLKGWSLDEIDENDGSVWPVPRFIPHGLTFVYGLPKSGKSLWMQKLSACIAGGVPFDGIEGLEHGRVLYISRDIGASRQEVKKRLMKILPHLGLAEDALNEKLILTDDPFYLNDPESVENLLAHNPGRFVLVVIDSLFRCVKGSLSQDVVASDAVDAIDRISRATGAAVVAIHHEPRSGDHLFGSVMLDAAYDAQIHVERGRARNSVTVTVQELKNAPIPGQPFTYRIEEEYLTPIAGVESVTAPKQTSSRHEEMLALFPAGWFTRKEGRKLVDPLLTGPEATRRKQWQRAVTAMEASGEIEVRATRMRKT
jgi:hypothetical protein